MTRKNNRERHEIRVPDCRSARLQQVAFPEVQTIARRRRRRVRRQGKKTTEIVHLISRLTREELEAVVFFKLKRGYWVIESRLHHALDVTRGEDRSRATTGKFPKRFRHRHGGPERLHALIFAEVPASWRLPK
jgi:hypothetical protein